MAGRLSTFLTLSLLFFSNIDISESKYASSTTKFNRRIPRRQYPIDDQYLYPPHSPSHYRNVMDSWSDSIRINPNDKVNFPLVRPTDFGADPSGINDSTQAFQLCLQAALQYNTSQHHLAFGVVDLGGVTMDLGGGDYLISQPIVWPVNTGNFRMIDGTLRASLSFPSDRWLIEVGNQSACTNGQGSCNEDAGFEGLFLDGNQVAAGGLRISATMGANVGPQMFFLNFTTAGIQLDGGHEVMIHETWIGEFLYSDKRKENGTASTAIGILINGNDHYVTNTIIFSSHVGVQLTGAANMITGVHTWNLALSNSGTGIAVMASQNRFDGIYLDFNDIIFYNTQNQVVMDAFFLCGGHVVFHPTSNNQEFRGVTLLGNEFECVGQGQNNTIEVNTTSGSFGQITDFTVVGTTAQDGFTIRSPSVTKVVTINNPTTSWTVDFSDALAFDTSIAPIVSVQYSFTLPSGTFTQHAARPSGNSAVVTVETSTPVSGTLTITVDQSYHSV